VNEHDSISPLPPETGTPATRKPSRLRRFFFRHLPLSICILLVLVAAAITGLYFWTSSQSFQNLVRQRIVHRLETVTGGRVQIASFHWNLRHLEASASGIVIHGLEAPGEAPYAEVQSLRLRLSILGFWSPRIILSDLQVTRPAFHLIVYPDGSTNQPHPRRPRKPGKPVIDTLFDLKAGHVEIRQGEIEFESRTTDFDFQNRSLPLDLDAAGVSLLLAYVPPENGNPESYHIEAGASHLNLFRHISRTAGQTAQGRVDCALDLTRNTVYLRSLRFSSGPHDLNLTGALHDFSRPRWQVSALGEFDMRMLDPILGYPFAPEGLARLDLTGAGQEGQFRADGLIHVDNGSYLGTGVTATGIGLDARIHADPSRLLITSIAVRLRQGGQIGGQVDLTRWLSPLPGTPVLEASQTALKSGAKSKPRIAKPASLSPVTLPVNGKVDALFQNVSLDTILDMVGRGRFQRLGLATLLNGPAQATWINGDDRTLAVSASLSLTQPAQPLPGEVPATGAVDATYTQRDGGVDLRNLQVYLPGSSLQAHGHLGAYPLSSPSGLDVDFRSRNLAEFDTVLRDLGMARNGRAGVSALPVALSGEATFHGAWAGSLIDPHISGSARATNLTIELPANPKDTSAGPQSVHFDTVDATGAYSAAGIDISHAQLTHGPASISLSGSLAAAIEPS